MKTAIYIPDELFVLADRMAKQLHLSRSALYARAVSEYLTEQHSTKVTERLNAVYGEQSSAVEPDIARAQLASLPEEEWK